MKPPKNWNRYPAVFTLQISHLNLIKHEIPLVSLMFRVTPGSSKNLFSRKAVLFHVHQIRQRMSKTFLQIPHLFFNIKSFHTNSRKKRKLNLFLIATVVLYWITSSSKSASQSVNYLRKPLVHHFPWGVLWWGLETSGKESNLRNDINSNLLSGIGNKYFISLRRLHLIH